MTVWDNKSSAVFLLLALLTCSNVLSIRPRRNSVSQHGPDDNSIWVVANSSQPCQLIGMPTQRLADVDLRAVFRQLGGEFVSTYMAMNAEDGRENFRNLLPIDPAFLAGNGADGRQSNKAIKKAELRSRLLAERAARGGDKVKPKDLMTNGETNEADGAYRALVLPEDLRIPTTFVTFGNRTTSVDYCIPRGTTTVDGLYLRMCTICAATSTFTENIWPRTVNEAFCSPDDIGCFFSAENTVAHGRCQQSSFPLNLMCKTPGQCVLALKDGQTIAIEEWEQCTQEIRVGCECAISIHSVFASFV